jgi:hypothetical protein
MLKLTFSIRMKMRLKGKCPKHPGYNPEEGEGAIRGVCPHCRALYEVVAARDALWAAAREFESRADPYRIAPKPRPFRR